jgi:hypothetical protein
MRNANMRKNPQDILLKRHVIRHSPQEDKDHEYIEKNEYRKGKDKKTNKYMTQIKEDVQ